MLFSWRIVVFFCKFFSFSQLTIKFSIKPDCFPSPRSSDCRSFQNFISDADPETLAALSGAQAGEVSPEMFRTASNMISKMSPEELQKMLQMASSFQGGNPYSTGGSLDASFKNFRAGSVPSNVTPDMLKTASDMMNKMPPDELQKMFEIATSLTGKASVPTAEALNTSGQSSNTGSKLTESGENFTVNGNNVTGEPSSSCTFSSSSRNAHPSSFPSSTADLQEQMRNQMKDPATRQVCWFECDGIHFAQHSIVVESFLFCGILKLSKLILCVWFVPLWFSRKPCICNLKL